jgi:HEAT repeat protein
MNKAGDTEHMLLASSELFGFGEEAASWASDACDGSTSADVQPLDDGLAIRLLKNPRTRPHNLALIERLSAQSIPATCDCLLSIPDPAMFTRIRTLFDHHPQVSIPCLETMASKGTTAQRLAAVEMLAAMESDVSGVVLARMVESGERRTRLHAIQMAGEHFVDRTLPALLRNLEDYDWEIRRDSVVAVGRLGVENSWLELSLLLDDVHVVVRRSVLSALNKIAAPDSMATLTRFLSDSDQASRSRAEAAIRSVASAEPASLLTLIVSGSELAEGLAFEVVGDRGVEPGWIVALAEDALSSVEFRLLVERTGWFLTPEGTSALADLADSDHAWVADFVYDNIANLSDWERDDLAQRSGSSLFIADVLESFQMKFWDDSDPADSVVWNRQTERAL